MRIVVNDIAASEGGALTILKSFYDFVSQLDDGNEWIFLLGGPVVKATPRIRTIEFPKVKASHLRRLVFDLFTGRRLIRRLRPDVVFSLQNTFTYWLKCPQVIYVHQPLPFQDVKRYSLLRPEERSAALIQHGLGLVIRRSIATSDHTIVQTNWMREAVLEQVAIEPDRITNVLPDFEDLSGFASDVPASAGSFFYPTSASTYKNNGLVCEASRLLKKRGVHDVTVEITADPPAGCPEIVALGRIPRAEVLIKLARSTLIFPSLIETYGLPLAEARALGSLVLAADLPYAREVLDGYENAYFFDPMSPKELADLMEKVTDGNIVLSPRETETVAVASNATDRSAWETIVTIIEDTAKDAGKRP